MGIQVGNTIIKKGKGGGGIPKNLTDAIASVSGVTSKSGTVLANAVAQSAVDEAADYTFVNQTTADGVSIKDTVAFVDKVKGNSLKVVQSCRYGNFEDTTGWKASGIATLSVSNNEAVITLNGSITSNYSGTIGTSSFPSVIAGHTYLLLADIFTPRDGAALIDSNGMLPLIRINVAANTWTTLYALGQVTTPKTVSIYPTEKNDGYVTGDIYKVRRVHYFDLTAMGMADVTTPADFAKRLGYPSIEAVPYIPYTEGEVTPMKAETIVSKGADASTLDTFPLPISSILHNGQPLFPDGLNGVGSVKDEVDFAKGRAVKRVGVVDLGSLNWLYGDVYGGQFTSTGMSTIVEMAVSASDTKVRVNCGILIGISLAARDDAVGPRIFIDTTGNILVRGTTYTDANTFKTAMSGVLLYYALAEPIVVSFPPQKAYYKVENGGSESIIAEGKTAPVTAEIGYRGITEAMALNLL